MNLVIDIGNTRVKLAIFDSNKIKEIFVFDKITENDINTLKNEFELSKCILSSVRQRDENLLYYLQNSFKYFVEFTGNTPLPFKNDYQSKNTQGADRIAAVTGALELCPGKNVLVIDAGTTITYEFLSSEGIYKGGNISPGIDMRFKALNTFTKRLPLVNKSDAHGFLGLYTENAILFGVQNGIVYEIEGYILSLQKDVDDLKVIITGGDSAFLARKLNKSILVEENLVLNGLNRVLEYNALL
jgi:type III pantothenate kinase